MKSEVLKAFPHIDLTCLGLMIFFIFFVSVVLWTYSKSNRERFAAASELPLEGDEL